MPVDSPLNLSAAVVLVHYGAFEVTRACLASLARHETLPHLAIVVDHGPNPGLERALEGVHPHLRVLTAHHNPGFGAGCNLGAALAWESGAEAVWFLNNDATLEGPLLEALTTLGTRFPAVGLWGTHQVEGGRKLGADRHPRWFACPSEAPPHPPIEGVRFLDPEESLSGASVLVTRAAWEAIGPWPEWCFLYWEDAAWCLQVRAQGKLLALSEGGVSHSRGTTTGRRSPRTIYYGARNALLLHRQLHPAHGATRLLMAFDLLQKRFFRGQWGHLRPTWRGVRDALRTPPRTGPCPER